MPSFAGRLAPPIVEPPEIEGSLPTLQQMMADLYELFRRDRANIEAGYYRLPHDLYGSPRAALAQSLRFLSDLGRIDRRRREGIHDEVRGAQGRRAARYPDYYVQNFHYQTDGYLSDLSAALYDFQVESCSKAAPMRCAARRCSRSRRFCAAGGSARSGCWTWGAAPAVSSASSSRTIRACRWSAWT